MPPVPPARGLWPRLEQARRRRISRFKTTMATTVILLLCLAILPLLGNIQLQPAPAPAIARSQPAAAPQLVLDEDTLARVRALDRALQTAYDEGARDDEVEPLWQARDALLPRRASRSSATTDPGNS